MSKAKAFVFSGVLLVSLVINASPARSADERMFEGEIADSQCATNVHSLTQSHNEMIAMGSAGKTAADCAHYCVKSRGGKYVLQHKHDVYKLDNQDLAEKSAGLKVHVTGTLDPKTNTIQVRSIEPVLAK